MATLQSPGVQVTVIDESFYTPSAPGTVPILFVATGQDKTNPSGGTAQGTTAANVGKVWVITSQRDLVDTFGTPKFYTDTDGNPIHGGELNEYGLQAAYSVLGVSSRAYIARADVDLDQLIPSTTIPVGTPSANQWWVDTDNSDYGVFEWDADAKNGRGDFTKVTPTVIDDTNAATAATGLTPKDTFGTTGDYAIVITSDNVKNQLWYKTTAVTNAWVKVDTGFNGGKVVRLQPHTNYPDFTTSTGLHAVTGSVWIKTTTPGSGANWSLKYYNAATQTWKTVAAPLYNSTRQALQTLDPTGGGRNITVGTPFVEYDFQHYNTFTSTLTNAVVGGTHSTFKVWRRSNSGATSIVSTASTYTTTSVTSFRIRETLTAVNTYTSSTWSLPYTVSIDGWTTSSTASLVSRIPAALRAAVASTGSYITTGTTNVSATYDSTTKKVTFSHALGGDFELDDGAGEPLKTIGFTTTNTVTNLYNVLHDNDFGTDAYDTGFALLASNWKPLSYEAKASAPYTEPDNGTLWYDANLGIVDIMVHDGSKWAGYLTVFPATDPGGPIVSALEPVDGDRSDGNALVSGDIWVSTADPDRYGKDIYVYSSASGMWELQDTTDQSSPDGWVFANARWSTAGADEDPAKIADLLNSSYVDPDAPDPALYPKGIRLWNMRRSGYNVKQYVVGHIDTMANNTRYLNQDMENYYPNRWTCVSGNDADGSGLFGRLAQRKFVVSGLKSLVDTNTAIRDTDTLTFNLIATPGYPETIANMVAFNNEIGQTAFVVGDTPFRLAPNATELTAWGTNSAKATDNGDDGLVTNDEYLGVFYPSGYTTDNTGNNIVVPASHMMLRTIINNDAKSYPWFAPAGTRRGGVDNATSVGYISAEGEFKTTALYQALRDVLQTQEVAVNPIATLPGVGLVNFGQRTRAKNASALDRINVVRLVAYLRRQLSLLAKPFLFEPNDTQTRREIKSAAENLLIELVGQRALYDFIVVCDTSNNTPARIDRSELYVDIAIEPVKAVEFIYIPLRIKNTGEIAAGK